MKESLGLVKIKGNFNGELNNGRRVVITGTGIAKGSITAHTLEIDGLVEGNVTVENLLVRPSGELHYGRLTYSDLVVENGGIMEKLA